jgi:hypothetical protein
VDSIRAGGTRLAGDLAAVETNMGELYDAAAGRASAESGKASPTPEIAPPAQEPLELASESSSENGDAEGARLVALNMALNGDSREETDRYLAENYEIEDRAKLLDEVYAAIEG